MFILKFCSMKKSILKLCLTLFVLVLIFSCSKERETIVIEDTTDTTSNIVIKLPENAISAEEFLLSKGIIKESKKSEDDNLQGRLVEGDPDYQPLIYYKRIFVLFPKEWSSYDRYVYLNNFREIIGKDIYTVIDYCDYVDTWYVEVSRDVPPSETTNKSKNLIVATNTTPDSNDTNTAEDSDGPGGIGGDEAEEEVNYTSCDQVPLPPGYEDPILQDGLGPIGGGSDDDDINTPKK